MNSPTREYENIRIKNSHILFIFNEITLIFNWIPKMISNVPETWRIRCGEVSTAVDEAGGVS